MPAETMTTPVPVVYQGYADESVRLESIPIPMIQMPGFQRDRMHREITKMAAEFDATGYAFPIVALFRGEFLALDGQQRLASLEMRGEESATVLLVQGVKTPKRLAAIFLCVNRDRKLLNALQKYIGALSAEDAGTKDIERIVGSFGYEVGKSASQYGKVPAGAIVTIHERGGNDLLERVLFVRECAWGRTPSREAFESKTLLGLAAFLRRHGAKVDDDRLINVLAKHHPGYILDRTTKTPTITYADYIREQYNKGLRGSKKL
jgi:hypothetical protein